ncbi:MAG TPA: hypothetical protein VK808_13920 [Bacteroidia bacterium]|nr:hypothetical protein [Bacteroidia bacterium]
MKKAIITSAIILSVLATKAQEPAPAVLNQAPINTWYGMTGAQLIFSEGGVNDNGATLHNIVRFTCFFHVQHQFHYDFGKAMGLYTGFSIINVGFINTIPVPDGSSATLKQRSYSVGIPLGLKFGNMPKGNYLAVGAEGECMFAYKQKILYNGNKTIFNDNLFSSNYVNLFNPSVFGELRFHNGTYIRFKYYLLNFLVDKTSMLDIGQYQVAYTPEKSTLYYLSVGLLLKTKHKHHLTKNDV